jgi:hypothetical protein
MRVVIDALVKLRKFVVRLHARYFMHKPDRDFISARFRKPPRSPDAPVVLVQCVENYYYLSLFDWIVGALRTRGSLTVDQFILRSLRLGSSSSPWGFIKARVYQNALTDAKWIRMYAAFCDRIAYRSAGIDWSFQFVRDVRDAFRIWWELDTKEDVLSLKMAGVLVGDLIYDSYLRFKPAATVDVGDFYLALVVWQAVRDVRRAMHYMSTVRPKVYLTSYSSYIQHGIAARVALQCGVRVFSFGNRQEIIKELTISDWVHLRHPDSYRGDFGLLATPAARLAEAEEKLGSRLAGNLDSATAYMSRSAYADSTARMPDVRGAIVVFLHDFFDSPHCYRWMLYTDFWEWTLATIRIAKSLNQRILLKPHPNQIAPSKGVVRRLRRMFPAIEFLSPSTSNRQLADGGIACALTVYGTVAHEMAYLGIPTITAGDHPHVSFDFCRTARDPEEYAHFIGQIPSFEYSRDDLRRQSLEFYYMHNLNFPPGYLQLRDALAKMAAQINNPEMLSIHMENYSRVAHEIRSNPDFASIVDTLQDILKVG